MEFTEEKQQEIIRKIDEAIKRKNGTGNFNCPVCKNDRFTLAGGFTNDFLMDKLGGGLIIGGPVLPSVPIVCTNCGNTFFLNAKILGIEIEDKQGVKDDKKDENKS